MILRGKQPKCPNCGARRLTTWTEVWDWDNLFDDGTPPLLYMSRTCKKCKQEERRSGDDS